MVASLKPKKEDRKKFDIDLEYGEIKEEKIASMLQDKKIEVKSERGMWMKTGNICIEYECWNKPSGINATESDYWFHNLCIDDKIFCTLVFETEHLKNIIKTMKGKKSVMGGDNNASKMWLLPLKKLFELQTYEEFRDNET
tara:strand:+ start:3193 stop:3615 length:423 start_codon:yes stop_codon:yes gene_type:complete